MLSALCNSRRRVQSLEPPEKQTLHSGILFANSIWSLDSCCTPESIGEALKAPLGHGGLTLRGPCATGTPHHHHNGSFCHVAASHRLHSPTIIGSFSISITQRNGELIGFVLWDGATATRTQQVVAGFWFMGRGMQGQVDCRWKVR